jgi:hypothetical protein
MIFLLKRVPAHTRPLKAYPVGYRKSRNPRPFWNFISFNNPFKNVATCPIQPTNIHVVHDCYCAAKLSLNYSEKSSSPLEHPALRNVKLINFFFLLFLGHFGPPGSGSSQQKSMRIRIEKTMLKTLTNGKVDGEALEDVLREMVDGEGVQDPGRDAEEEQQVTRILLLLASLPHTGRQRFQAVLRDPGCLFRILNFYPSRIPDVRSRISDTRHPRS